MISKYNPREAYNLRAYYKVDGTTTWIANKEQFIAWLDPMGPKCLWLNGKSKFDYNPLTTSLISLG